MVVINVTTEAEDRLEFLRRRQKGIGGSDLPVILGLVKGKNALDVYHDKTRPIRAEDEGPPTIDQWRGRVYEPHAIAAYFEHTGRDGDPGGREVSPGDEHPFRGHTDGEIASDEEREPDEPDAWRDPGAIRERGVLEIKCPRSQVFRRIVDRGLRQSEIVQAQAYCAGGGYRWCSFGFYNAEDDAGPIISVDVEADPRLGDFLLEVAERFWREHVEPRVPPDPEEWRLLEDPDAPRVVETTGELTEVDDPEIAELAEMVLEAKATKKKGEALYDERKAELQAAIEDRFDTDRILVPGVAKLTIVRNAGRESFSRRALEAHRPIDRDKLFAWMRENGPDTFARGEDDALERWLADLELDLDAFKRQGSPYSYLLPTSHTE